MNPKGKFFMFSITLFFTSHFFFAWLCTFPPFFYSNNNIFTHVLSVYKYKIINICVKRVSVLVSCSHVHTQSPNTIFNIHFLCALHMHSSLGLCGGGICDLVEFKKLAWVP